jgi:hypothetical protein
MSKPFFESVATLDSVIAAGPTAIQYERDLAPMLSDDTLNEYFFRNLSDPAWLEPLVKAGKFSSVPAPQENKTEGTIGFPFWPQGEYLKKIAPQVPDEICKVVSQLPPTGNARVHDSILELALTVPPRAAVEMVPKIIEGLRSPHHLGLPLKIPSLISLLAKAGYTPSALQLAEAALEISSEAGSREKGKGESRFSNLREPISHIGVWHYERVLTKGVPDLVDAAGEQALDVLCNLLDRAILLSDRRGAECRPNDFSHIWRPAIEEHQQNLNMGVKHLLVTAVRDAAEQIARKSPARIPALLELLEKRGNSWWVFRRIALHLLRLFPDSTAGLLRERLLNRELFDSVEVRHEYFLLEKECFGRLGDEDQKVILGWIDEGPTYSAEHYKRWEEFTGKPWTDEDKTRYERQWKRDRLAPLDVYLTGSLKELYGQLQSEVGAPNHPEFTSYHEGGFWGPQSPQRQDDLVKLPVKDLITFLANWKPTGNWFRGASPEGLGRELASAITSDPQKYAKEATEFKRLSEPTYIRSVVQGFESAVKQKRTFDWFPVLDLCVWAMAQERELPGRSAEQFEKDAHWGWTRAAVARLLTSGFSSEENPISFEARKQVWLGIEPGTRDPQPTREQEKEYWQGGDWDREPQRRAQRIDPFTNAINTPRGVAMEAVVQYALWVRKGFEKSNDKDVLLVQGFGAMPEVQEVLDLHLDPKTDPSVTIRAVYGQRAPWLQLLDEKWAREKTSKMFARDNGEFWHAAWDTYIGYSQPYDKVFEWLASEYLFAIDQIDGHDHGWGTPEGPDNSLAQHLMSFYWRGKLDLSSEILEAFYRRAGVKLRAHALNFVGRSLRNTEGSVPTTVATRLKQLWNKRLEAVSQQVQAGAEELKEYGWWFASRKLDDDWSIAQLLGALKLAKQVEPDHLVVERLVEMAQIAPLHCIEALRMMIEGDAKGWAVLGWQDKAEDIIRSARKSGDSKAREAAEELVNLLGSRGHFDFGKLLKEPIQ